MVVAPLPPTSSPWPLLTFLQGCLTATTEKNAHDELQYQSECSWRCCYCHNISTGLFRALLLCTLWTSGFFMTGSYLAFPSNNPDSLSRYLTPVSWVSRSNSIKNILNQLIHKDISSLHRNIGSFCLLAALHACGSSTCIYCSPGDYFLHVWAPGFWSGSCLSSATPGWGGVGPNESFTSGPSGSLPSLDSTLLEPCPHLGGVCRRTVLCPWASNFRREIRALVTIFWKAKQTLVD